MQNVGFDSFDFGRGQCLAGTPRDASLAPTKVRLENLFEGQIAERYASERALCWEGHPATHIFQLVEGYLRVYRTTEDGRRAIIRFGYAGNILGLCAGETYSFTAEAVTPVRFRRFSRSRFDELIKSDPDLAAELRAEMRRRATISYDHILRLGRTAGAERVASFILDVAQSLAASGLLPTEITVPWGRLDIADYLGLTMETVCRELSRLKRRGVVSMQGPHRITLDRPSELCKLAKVPYSQRLWQAELEPAGPGLRSPASDHRRCRIGSMASPLAALVSPAPSSVLLDRSDWCHPGGRGCQRTGRY